MKKNMRKSKSKSVSKSMKIWLMAGVLFVVLGGAYLVMQRNEMTNEPEINLIGQQLNASDYFVDRFNNEEINDDNWDLYESMKDVSLIKETKKGNLTINLKEIAGAKNLAHAGMIAKKPIKEDQDIRVVLDIYRPSPLKMVDGAEIRAGLRFVANDDDKEDVSVGWKYVKNPNQQGRYYVYFKGRGANGELIENDIARAYSSKTRFTVDRVKANGRFKYVFYFTDDIGDNVIGLKKLGEMEESWSNSLGGDGKVRVFATSKKVGDKYVPASVRFDQFRLVRKDGLGTMRMFSDKFGLHGNDLAFTSFDYDSWSLVGNYPVHTTDGGPWVDRGLMHLLVAPNKTTSGTAKKVRVLLKQTLPADKTATAVVVMKRPYTVESNGVIIAGVGFDEAKQKDGAEVYWQENKLMSKITNAAGEVEKKVLADIPQTTQSVRVKFSRGKDVYRISYALSDEGWKLAQEVKATGFGNKGKFYLFASNSGVGNQYPRGSGVFDSFLLTYEP